jgi:RNase P/RNase MRP subunit p30
MRYIDLVFPNGNELLFMQMAEKLSYSGICFVYEYNRFRPAADIFSEFSRSNLNQTSHNNKLDIYSGIICAPKEIQKARNKADFVIVNDIENIRETVEKHKPDVLFGVEMQKKRDYMHQRNSGINQVVCDIANTKNVAFGIPFRWILEARNKQILLGRIMQNLKLYKKYKSKIIFASFAERPMQMRSPKDLISFLIAIGIESRLAKISLVELSNIIERNKKIRDKKLIHDSIEIIEDISDVR